MINLCEPERKCHFNYWLLLLALTTQIVGCAAVKDSQNPDIFSYAYLTFNFSGERWNAARARCESKSKKAKHLGTNCGFWICTTEVMCIDDDDVSDR